MLPPAIGRLVAPAAAGVLVYAALAGLTPEPAVPAALAAAVTAAMIVVLPRAGWLVAAVGVPLLLTLGPVQRPGAALLVAALALASPLLLRADGRAWALPAAAPALGLIGLAGAYPALAGRAPRWTARLALGALGAWWLVLAEPLLERTLVLGVAPGTPCPAELRRRARHHRRRRDRARRIVRRAPARAHLGRRRARPAVDRARPLAVGRRGRGDRLGRRNRRRDGRAGRVAGRPRERQHARAGSSPERSSRGRLALALTHIRRTPPATG